MNFFKEKALDIINFIAEKLGYQLVSKEYHFMIGAIDAGLLIGIDTSMKIDLSVLMGRVINNDDCIGLEDVIIMRDSEKFRNRILEKYAPILPTSKNGRGRPKKNK